MKIGMVVSNEFINDPRVTNQARYLVENGIEVHVLCYNHGNNKGVYDHFGIKVHSVNIEKGKANKLFALNNISSQFEKRWTKEIISFVANANVELLHVHDLYMAVPAANAVMRQIPIVLDLHENYPAAIQGYHWATKFPNKLIVQPDKYKSKELKALTCVDNIVVLSTEFRDQLCAEYNDLKPTKFIHYPNVPDVDKLKSYEIDEQILDKQPQDIVLFYFGAIAERRGIYTCIDALKLILADHPNIKLLIIGPVDKKEHAHFHAEINDESVRKNIIYYEWKDISLLPSYILASDICLSPIVKNDQHDSGIANKVFQYMLFDRPLIVSNSVPQSNLVKQFNCGSVFESENVEDLKNKIVEMIADANKMKEMGANGKRAVQETYNVQHFGKNLINAYNELKK